MTDFLKATLTRGMALLLVVVLTLTLLPGTAVLAKDRDADGPLPMGQGEDKYFIEFMLRESDLTEELKKLREDKIKEIIRKFSKAGDKAPEIAAHPQSYSILN